MNRVERTITKTRPLDPEQVVQAAREASGLEPTAVEAGIKSHGFSLKTAKPPFFSDIRVYFESSMIALSVYRDRPIREKPDVEALDALARGLVERLGGEITAPVAAR